MKLDDFLNVADEFKLGTLPTEGFHPKSHNLSELSKNNLKQGISILSEIDLLAFQSIQNNFAPLELLRENIHKVLKSGNKIFLCGCGATGRLALALEHLWRKKEINTSLQNSVVSFMAGGDVALVHSIESFEDHPEYGKQQLIELGF